MEIGIIIGQDAYEIQRPLYYKIGTRNELLAVLTELGWVVSGPMTGKRRQNVCHFILLSQKMWKWLRISKPCGT